MEGEVPGIAVYFLVKPERIFSQSESRNKLGYWKDFLN
jgi:hypothetical protein